MEAAYTDVAGRAVSSAAQLNVFFSDNTFTPGVYVWGSNVFFSAALTITLEGNSDDVFIFKSSGNVVVGSGTKVILKDDGTGKGAPLASNIVWQVEPIPNPSPGPNPNPLPQPNPNPGRWTLSLTIALTLTLTLT
jgi:hypothetical protein